LKNEEKKIEKLKKKEKLKPDLMKNKKLEIDINKDFGNKIKKRNKSTQQVPVEENITTVDIHL